MSERLEVDWRDLSGSVAGRVLGKVVVKSPRLSVYDSGREKIILAYPVRLSLGKEGRAMIERPPDVAGARPKPGSREKPPNVRNNIRFTIAPHVRSSCE